METGTQEVPLNHKALIPPVRAQSWIVRLLKLARLLKKMTRLTETSTKDPPTVKLGALTGSAP